MYSCSLLSVTIHTTNHKKTLEISETLGMDIKVTYNPCSLHLVSFFLNSSKHTEPYIKNSPSVW